MASATLMVGRGWEASCSGGASAVTITSKGNSAPKAVAATFQRTNSGGFDKTFFNGVGKRGAVIGEPVAVFRSLSRSSSFSGTVASPRHRCSDVRRSNSSRQLAAQAMEAVQVTEKLPVNVEMLEAYEIEEKVRDYELDHYGVVNNAIYAQFCQHARHELLEHVGFSPDSVTQSDKSMAISQMSMKFVSPLRSGDRYIVSSRVSGTSPVRIYFEEHIYKLPHRELVMSAKTTVVFLDHNNKAIRVPDEIKSGILRYKVRIDSPIGQIDVNPKNDHINCNSTNGHVDGKPTNGHVNDNTTNDQVDGNSTNIQCNGNSTNDQVNGSSTNAHVNDVTSRTGLFSGNSANGHYSGNSTRVITLVA